MANEIKLICEVCGEACSEGYEVHADGKADPETGYREETVYCTTCIEQSERDAAGDSAYEMEMEA